MTQVPATRSATTKVPKYQLDKCKATRTQHKTRSPRILNPAKKAANYATQRKLLLFFVRNNPAITISSLLLPCNFECPATMTVTNAKFSLQLIVESFFTGEQVAKKATICNDSFKLIDLLDVGPQVGMNHSLIWNIDKSLPIPIWGSPFRHGVPVLSAVSIWGRNPKVPNWNEPQTAFG